MSELIAEEQNYNMPTDPPAVREFDEEGTIEELEAWKTSAKKLWGLLDDIDTYPDMMRPSSDNAKSLDKLWRTMVDRAEKRHDILVTDGYVLDLPKED